MIPYNSKFVFSIFVYIYIFREYEPYANLLNKEIK